MNFKIKNFGLIFERDIICICTGGAPFMIKFGRILNSYAFHQVCDLHTIQLAVIDVNERVKNPKNLDTFI